MTVCPVQGPHLAFHLFALFQLHVERGPGYESKCVLVNIICGSYAFLCTDATAYSGARFGQGSSLIITLDEVSCTGEETSLFSCMHTTSHDCTHTEDAAVLCSTRELNFFTIIRNNSSLLQECIRAERVPVLMRSCYLYSYCCSIVRTFFVFVLQTLNSKYMYVS